MNDRLRIGILGTGNMGKNHARILASEPACFEFAAIYDPAPIAAERLAGAYGVRPAESAEALLEDVDAVVIAAPSSLHKEIGLLAVRKGVHALIEKPLALNEKDALELNEAFSKAGLKLMAGHVERFNPVITELGKLLTSEALIAIEARRYAPYDGRILDASVVEDLMVHDIDIVCNALHPADIQTVHAACKSVKSQRADFAHCTVVFADGVLANITASRVTESKVREILLHTRDSYIVADLLNRTLNVLQSTNFVVEGGGGYRQESVSKRVFVPMVEPLRMELLAFRDCILKNTPPLTSGFLAAKTMNIVERVEMCQ